MLASYWQDLCLSTFIKCHCTTYWVRLLVQQEAQRRFSRRINSSVRSALKCHNGIKGCRRQDENVKHSFIMSKIPLVPLDKQQYERSEKSLFSKWRYVIEFSRNVHKFKEDIFWFWATFYVLATLDECIFFSTFHLSFQAIYCLIFLIHLRVSSLT